MPILALAFLIGVLDGLRSLMPPAVAAWAAHLGWIKLQGGLALIGSVPVVVVFTLLAALELFSDTRPWVPNRTSPLSLLFRCVMGALAAACVAAAGGQSAGVGAACGVAGAIAGAFAGFHTRVGFVRAVGTPDIYVALVEDFICVAGAVWVFSRIQ